LVKLQAKKWLSRKYFAFALTVTFRGVVKNSRISCAEVYVNIFLVYSTIVKYLLAKLRYLIQLVAHYCYQAVIDRRLRPRCFHLGSYFKRPQCSPVRPLASNWYYCAQFIAKPNTACVLRFSWAATSSNLGL